MKVTLTLPEKIKDLRIEQRLKLSDVAQATGISATALSTYENDELKEIPHTSIVALAKFYNVSTDYLLGLSSLHNPDPKVLDFDISDSLANFLRQGNFNRLLLSEFLTHPNFPKLLADMEIYIDGLENISIQTLNALIDKANEQICQRFTENGDVGLASRNPEEVSRILHHIEDDSYFFNRIGRKLNDILEDLRHSHEKDKETAEGSYLADVIENSLSDIRDIWDKDKDDPEKRAADYLFYMICQDLRVPASSLTSDEKAVLTKLIVNSRLYKEESKKMRRRDRWKRKKS